MLSKGDPERLRQGRVHQRNRSFFYRCVLHMQHCMTEMFRNISI
jgi:hypothetical protein